MSQMLKSSGAMGLATLSSRLLGLVREQVYAHFMGDTAVASAFKLAFQIPNLFRRLLGEGALTAAFIPIFKTKEKTEGEAAMWQAANATISGLVVAVSAIVAVVLLGLTLVLSLAKVQYADGGVPVYPPFPFPILNPDTRLMLELLRLMFPYLLLVCLAALCMGMLNARGCFFIPALGATMLNVVMIASVLLLAPRLGQTLETQIFGLAIGVLVAGLAQVGFQLPPLFRQGYRYRWVTPWGNQTVRQVVRKMVPGAIGVAAFQLNVLVIQCVAFWVDRSIVASFDYAVRIMEFPQGIVGISLATYLLPTLAGLAGEKRYPQFRATLREGLGYLVMVNLLASILLVTLAEPVVRLLFQRGAFTAASTHRVSLALACLAPGLVAFSMVNVLARAFYALGDTQTPMRISLVCLGLNLVFSLWLIGPFRQAGLGVANTMSSVFNVWLLLRALRKKLARLEFEPFWPSLLALAGATVLAGLCAWGLRHLWEVHYGHATLAARLGEVFIPLSAATAVYWGLAWWLKIPEARAVKTLFARRAQRGNGPPPPGEP
ncbi:MAG: murein biosynthesis integral membrane protein MurJ [Verrucomicrobia bacterium]|nr:murein biosynthesis integral membrane protein MurJ [Verrucomicrobiota bacterium]